MSEVKAKIRSKVSKFEQMLEEVALAKGANEWVHDDVYLRITDESVQAIQTTNGNSVMSYGEYDAEYFDVLGVSADGGETEVLLNVNRTLDVLGVTQDAAGHFEVSFEGPEDGLASTMVLEGALNARVTLPRSASVYENVQTNLPERFGDDGEFLSPSGNVHHVFVETDVSQFERVYDAVELENGFEYYPVSVDGDGLQLELEGENSRESIWGNLSADSVEWTVDVPEDGILNWYGPGYEPVFRNTLSGVVEVQLSPGAPMAVVSRSNDRTIHHVLTTVR